MEGCEQSSRCWCAGSCLTPLLMQLPWPRAGKEDAWVLEHLCCDLSIKKKKKNLWQEPEECDTWGWKFLTLMAQWVTGFGCAGTECAGFPNPPQKETAAGQSTATASHWYMHSNTMFLPIPDKFPMYYLSRISTFVKIIFCQISRSSRLLSPIFI